MTDRTCADRLPEHMQGRAEHLSTLYRIAEGSATDADYAAADIERDAEGWGAEGAAHDALSEFPLSIEVVRTIKVLLSTGGPADGLTIELTSDGEVNSVRYWFADWFDHAEDSVPADSPLWRYAEDLAEIAVSNG